MTMEALVHNATHKEQFQRLNDYIDFCQRYLDFVSDGLQARIVSQNENHYEFFQYREDGGFNITRPINSRLMYDAAEFGQASTQFRETLVMLRDSLRPPGELRDNIIRTIYTVQQSIGATLDALPGNKSNQARKVNGDLFERLICLLITSLDVDCLGGTMQVPVKDLEGNELFRASYQHDLLIKKDDELKIIGSVKTSSKDRIDKVFMDKFLYSRLTDTALPHIAIFLNDVQRKNTKRMDKYGVSATFLPGHFKAYTMKLNALDGVYYCDIRPNMISDKLLSQHIRTIDHFFFTDLWGLLDRHGQSTNEVTINKDDATDDIEVSADTHGS